MSRSTASTSWRPANVRVRALSAERLLGDQSSKGINVCALDPVCAGTPPRQSVQVFSATVIVTGSGRQMFADADCEQDRYRI
jgi:hypothetical protein